MPIIYDYVDYRLFLKDFYNEQKSSNKAFSFKYFANKAGFKSKSFIKLVIDGKKNLTEDSINKLNAVLKLNDKAFSYLCDLVAFNQSQSVQHRNFYFDKIMQYNKRNAARKVLVQQYEIYSKWYFNAIRELVTILDFKEDYEILGKMLKPPISEKKAREAVDLLVKLGFIEKKEGKYIQCEPIITTGDEVRSLAVTNFHIENLAIASKSIETVCSSDRDISCIVAGLSDDGFKLVKEEIQKFRKKILDIAALQTNVSYVYHLNFQILPVSERIDEKNN